MCVNVFSLALVGSESVIAVWSRDWGGLNVGECCVIVKSAGLCGTE